MIIRDERYDRMLEQLAVRNKDVRVSLCHLNEGYNGDYDATNPKDRRLLRLDVLIADRWAEYLRCDETSEDGWVYPWDGSTCTQLEYGLPEEALRMFLNDAAFFLTDALRTGGSRFRSVMESLSSAAMSQV